jgi:hypothetical protein
MRKIEKKGAMEMSVGTIVTIVLLMSVLVLGIFLVQRIFKSASGAVDLTDDQLKNEINKLFGDDKELVIYPSSGLVEIKQEETDGVGIGIKNLVMGVSGDLNFKYEVVIGSENKCGVDNDAILDWIAVGKSESGIPLASGGSASQKILFQIPTGAPLCVINFRVNVNVDKGNGYEYYDTKAFNIEIKAK